MDEWRYQVETPERVPVGIFVFALITAIPCCAFCVGVVLSRLEEKPEEVTKKAKQDHGIQRPIGS